MRKPNYEEIKQTIDGIAARMEQMETEMVSSGDTQWLSMIRFIHWDIVTLAMLVSIGEPEQATTEEAPKRRGRKPRVVEATEEMTQ
jgi:hypothetical protein